MGEQGVKVRRAEARDMAFVIELWKGMTEELAKCDERYELRPDAEIIWARWAGQHLRNAESCLLVAENGGEYVGYLLAHAAESQPIFKHRKHATITDIYVVPQYRRKGIAKRLIEEAASFFKAHGVQHMQVNVLVKNASARAFVEKMGFVDFLYRMWKAL